MPLYRIADFFKPVDQELAMHGSKHAYASPNSSSITLTHLVRFRIEQETVFDLRELEIEYYSDKSMVVAIRTIHTNSNPYHGLHILHEHLKLNHVKDEDTFFVSGGRFYAGGADRPSLCLLSLDAFRILIDILEYKIPAALLNDLISIFHFMNGSVTEYTVHEVKTERSFFIDSNNEQMNQLFDLVSRSKETESSCVDNSGHWFMIQPKHSKEPIRIKQIKENGIMAEFFLVQSRLHGGFRLLNSFGKAPFKAYDVTIKQKYDLVYEAQLQHALLDLYDDGVGNPKYPLFQKSNNQWQLMQKTIPQLMYLPIKEFDWLVSHTVINPNHLDERNQSLIYYIINNDLADCLGTLLCYGINPHTAYTKYSLKTLYEAIYKRVHELSSEQLHAYTQLDKMWRYFQPTLRKAPATYNRLPLTHIDLLADTRQITSKIVTTYSSQVSREFESIFKSAALLQPEEKTQFISLVERQFNALITQQDKEAFTGYIIQAQSSLTLELATQLWCLFIEKRFNCSLTVEQKVDFLNLMTGTEISDFYLLLRDLSNQQSQNLFWQLLSDSMVRYSTAKDLAGANKFIELLYKITDIPHTSQRVVAKKLIAGMVHELVILPEHKTKQKKPIVWHYALAAKDSSEPMPPGLIQFLIFRAPFSLGLNYSSVVAIGFNLNTYGFSLTEALHYYFPKYRSQKNDERVLKIIHSIYGPKVTVFTDGMAYYIQEYIQAKNIALDRAPTRHLFDKFSGKDNATDSQAGYRAVPLVFSTSNDTHRKKLNRLMPDERHKAHMCHFFKALLPLVEPVINQHTPLAKL